MSLFRIDLDHLTRQYKCWVCFAKLPSFIHIDKFCVFLFDKKIERDKADGLFCKSGVGLTLSAFSVIYVLHFLWSILNFQMHFLGVEREWLSNTSVRWNFWKRQSKCKQFASGGNIVMSLMCLINKRQRYFGCLL